MAHSRSCLECHDETDLEFIRLDDPVVAFRNWISTDDEDSSWNSMKKLHGIRGCLERDIDFQLVPLSCLLDYPWLWLDRGKGFYHCPTWESWLGFVARFINAVHASMTEPTGDSRTDELAWDILDRRGSGNPLDINSDLPLLPPMDVSSNGSIKHPALDRREYDRIKEEVLLNK